MSLNILNFPEDYVKTVNEELFINDLNLNLKFNSSLDKVIFNIGGLITKWIEIDDDFISRIQYDNLNQNCLKNHLFKEIEIKNKLDEGIIQLNNKRYSKAIECFDEVLYYDVNYSQALLNKSFALAAQGHFVKSLRFYRKSINNSHVSDKKYYNYLLKESSNEISNFPKIKSNVYNGDECFIRNDFENAIKYYDLALDDQSKFKEKIFSKLLNKKATALINLNNYNEALDLFNESLKIEDNDYAHYAKGYCFYNLNKNPKDMRCRCNLKKLYKHYALESFKKANNITKRQLLNKALILNELEHFKESLNYFTEFLNNHYINDEDYKKAIEGYKIALNHLN